MPITPNKTDRAIIRDWAYQRAERYRITADGEVHLYGPMPNSIETGWWLAHNDYRTLRREIMIGAL